MDFSDYFFSTEESVLRWKVEKKSNTHNFITIVEIDCIHFISISEK